MTTPFQSAYNKMFLSWREAQKNGRPGFIPIIWKRVGSKNGLTKEESKAIQFMGDPFLSAGEILNLLNSKL